MNRSIHSWLCDPQQCQDQVSPRQETLQNVGSKMWNATKTSSWVAFAFKQAVKTCRAEDAGWNRKTEWNGTFLERSPNAQVEDTEWIARERERDWGSICSLPPLITSVSDRPSACGFGSLRLPLMFPFCGPDSSYSQDKGSKGGLWNAQSLGLPPQRVGISCKIGQEPLRYTPGNIRSHTWGGWDSRAQMFWIFNAQYLQRAW